MASMMGCLGVWVTDAVEPEGDYISIYCATDRTLEMAFHTSDDYFYVDWGDGNIKQYAGYEGISGSFKFVNGGNTIKVYNVSNFTDFNIMQIDSVSDLDLITSLDDIDLGINATDINFIPTSWPITQMVLRVPNATNVAMNDDWDIRSLYIRGQSLTTINTSASWVNITTIDISDDTGGVLTSFVAHAEWVNIVQFYITNMALSEATVNSILTTMDATGARVNVNLSGGTSAAPTGAGITAAENIWAKGGSVITN